MRSMALLYASPWILFVILLNHGIITVNSCHVNLEGLVEFGIPLPLDFIGVGEEAENGQVKRIIESNEAMSSIRHILTQLDYEYESFPLHANSTEEELVKISEDYISSESDSVMRRLLDIMESVQPEVSAGDKVPLFDLAVKPYLDQGIAVRRCNEAMSVQQEIYRMYGIVHMYVIKAYSMILDAYQILEGFTTNQYDEKREKTGAYVIDALITIRKSAISAMYLAPKEIRSCDPEIHVEGETYIELKHLFNTVLFWEPDLSESDSCSQTCEEYKWINPYRMTKENKPSECSGIIYDCASTPQTHYCPAAESNRRYDAVSSSNIEECRTSVKEITVGTWFFHYCDSCACTCDEKFHDDTVRRFGLMEMRSNIAENYVITGLRLVQMRTVICIQIQEGKLQSDGRIITSTVQWQLVNESCTQDFLEMTYEHKSVDLDTVHPPNTQVMTGIRFVDRDYKLALSIECHKFNYSSGVLYNKGSWWFNGIFERKEIKIENPANPINADGENIVTLEVNHHVDFTMTDWNKDLSQVAVPFIDAQPVITNPPLPLSGAGLYYRGQTGYGGFIGLKLVTLDYAQLLEQTSSDIFPEPQSCPEVEESAEEETEDNTEDETDNNGEEEAEEDTGGKTQDETDNNGEEEAEEDTGEKTQDETDNNGEEEAEEDTGGKTQDDTEEGIKGDTEEGEEEGEDTEMETMKYPKKKEDSEEEKDDGPEDGSSEELKENAFDISQKMQDFLDALKDNSKESEEHHLEHSDKHDKNHKDKHHKVDPKKHDEKHGKNHDTKDPKESDGKDLQKPDGKDLEKPGGKDHKKPGEKDHKKPGGKPSKTPSRKPSKTPSRKPSKTPSAKPSKTPSRKPSKTPSQKPSKTPSRISFRDGKNHSWGFQTSRRSKRRGK